MTYEEFYNIRSRIACLKKELNTYEKQIFMTAMLKVEHCAAIPQYLAKCLKTIEEKYL